MSTNVNNILNNIDCDNDEHAVLINFTNGGLIYTSIQNTRVFLNEPINTIQKIAWTGNNFRKQGLIMKGFNIDIDPEEIFENFQIIIEDDTYYMLILDISKFISNYNNNIVGYYFNHKIFDLIKIT